MALNIFEALGLPADHRKQSETLKLSEGVPEVSMPCFIQGDVVGVPCIVLSYEGVFGIYSLAGKPLKNVDEVITHIKFKMDYRGDFVAVCKLCCEGLSEELLTKLTSHLKKTPLEHYAVTEGFHLAIFDSMSIEDFIAGTATLGYALRRSHTAFLCASQFPAYRTPSFYITDDTKHENVLEALDEPFYISEKSGVHFSVNPLYTKYNKEVSDL